MRASIYILVSLLVWFPSLDGFTQGLPEELDRGHAIYKKNCLRCHGPNGEGNGPDAVTLMVPPANFHAHESRVKSEMELHSAVLWGRAFSPMHGWFNKLTIEEMKAVVRYIRQNGSLSAKLTVTITKCKMCTKLFIKKNPHHST